MMLDAIKTSFYVNGVVPAFVELHKYIAPITSPVPIYIMGMVYTVVQYRVHNAKLTF